MVDFLFFIAALVLFGQALIGLAFFVSCVVEREKRAAFFAAVQLAVMLMPLALLFLFRQSGFLDTAAGVILMILGLALAGAAVFFFCRHTGVNPRAVSGTGGYVEGDVRRFDERAHVFARNRSLLPDSAQYREFYRDHPELEAGDQKRRAIGGPLGPVGAIDRPSEGPNIAATFASLNIPVFLSEPDKFNPPPHPALQGRKFSLSPEEASARIKGYSLKVGADMVGIARLDPLWVYSHRGEIFHENWQDWGQPIDFTHDFAIVFAHEMSLEMVATGPHTPTVIESMREYAKGAFIATQVASFIANLGYSATANHVRHYDALMVPLAVDAGLGEMGRLGYLMTKRYGPRIRLSAVTTDLPLVADQPIDIGVEDFCRACKKCARCCPSQSIPVVEEPAVVNAIRRWKLDAETCFDYWGKVGTDCDVCMRVCPWSHADTLPHRVIKFLVSRNRHARRIFTLLDDVFYGRKPKPKPAPYWAAH